MRGKNRTREQLTAELAQLRLLVARFAARDAEREQALRRLAIIVRDSNDAITVQDLKGRILAWNPAAEAIYGYSEAEALGMNITDVVPEDKRMEARSLLGRLGQGEDIGTFETRRVAKDGRTLDVQVTMTALVNEDGKPYAVGSTERDITHRKRTEQKIMQQNEFLNQLTESLTNPLYVIDAYDYTSKEANALSHSSKDARRLLS